MLAETIYISDPDTVIPLSEQTIAIADQSLSYANPEERKSLLTAKASALNNIGMIKGMHGDHKSEINYINKSLEIQLKLNNLIGIAAAYNNLGYIYTDYGDLQRSLEYYHKAIPLQEKGGDTEGLANTLNNIGYIYLNEKETALALDYFNKSLALRTKINDKFGQAMCLNNIGNLYEKNGAPGCGNSEACLIEGRKKALGFYRKSLDLQQQINDKRGIAYSLNNIAIQYKTIGYPEPDESYDLKKGEDSALVFFMKSLALQKEIQNQPGIAFAYNNISNLLLNKGKKEEAKKYALESYAIGNKIGNAEIIKRAAGTLKDIYLTENNFKEAFKYYADETRMRDSINNEESRKITIRRNFQYEFDKKTAEERARAQAEKQLSDLKLQKEKDAKNYLIIVVIATTLILIILIFLITTLVKSNKQRKEAYLALEQKNIEIQKQTSELVKLSREIAKYQSQMNPHFIFNALNSVQGLVINNEKEKSLIQLTGFAKLMRQTLNNSNKETIGIEEEVIYLKQYIQFEQERFNSKLIFLIQADDEAYEYEIPPMLIQPLIENSLKHAGLHTIKNPEIRLTINLSEDHLAITISDNGSGIKKDISALLQDSHALSMIRSRIELLYESHNLIVPEYILLINTVPKINEGTQITLLLPLISKY